MTTENTRTAQGYEAVAIELEDHVSNYTPEGWREPIKVCFNSRPFITSEKAKILAEAYKQGNLEQELEEDENNLFRDFPCIIAATMDFFEKGLHKKYVK